MASEPASLQSSTSTSPARPLFTGLMGAQVLFFVGSRILTRKHVPTKFAPAHPLITRHFASNLRNLKDGRYYTLFTHSMMHATVPHLALNLVCLWGTLDIISEVGEDKAMALYASGVVASGLGRILFNRYCMPRRFSLMSAVGASGGVFAMFAAHKLIYPKRNIELTVKDQKDVPVLKCVITPWGLLATTLGIEALCLLLLRHSSRVSYISHLVGAAWGIGVTKVFLEEKKVVK